MIRLGVNIDHVATLRQARRGAEPDPVWAAAEAELGGADGITVHLREDRRHIQTRDVELLRETVQGRLNLEMAASPGIVRIALRLKPDQATLVPERRQEVTTEGGLDVVAGGRRLREAIKRLRGAGITVNLFINAAADQIERSADLCAHGVELHTGEYALAGARRRAAALADLAAGAVLATNSGLFVAAGHGLNYLNVGAVAALPQVEELNIGHSIVSRAVFVGLREAVRGMREAIAAGRAGTGPRD